jgi:VIT1/CCC1 family predicted Fe2+/Mn2+ transporter
MPHHEVHRLQRAGWLRAAVLGANDGVISTASLMVGIVASGSSPSTVLTVGIAGLTAGAMSMAAGEYVSVRSQVDIEHADIARETHEIATQPDIEHAELAAIYRSRGLDRELAQRVADQLMAKDPLAAHIRDELGITERARARPLQAAMASAISFAAGACVPIAAALVAPRQSAVVITATTLVALLGLGGMAARAGGSPIVQGAVRVAFWGALAMAFTSVIGSLIGEAPP